MRDYFVIGSTPIDEPCIQVRPDNDYHFPMKQECCIYKRQLERFFPEPPPGISFSVKRFEHDFGAYTEVCVYFDDDDETQIDYAARVEGSPPERWDATAREELKQIIDYERFCR